MAVVNEYIRFSKGYILKLRDVLKYLPFDKIAETMAVLEKSLDEKRQVFLAGNGGSASTASHMATDLMHGIGGKFGTGLRAVSLADNTSLITATANDVHFDEIFATQLRHLAMKGDVLIVISGSGNSPNIIRAAHVGREMGLKTIGFLGMGGGKVAELVDVPVIVPTNGYGPIEDIHLVMDHLIVSYFQEKYRLLVNQRVVRL
jgi:D-sedoheptulose 7-phosphate isomerase